MPRFLEIAQGWANFVHATVPLRQMAMSRLVVCESCPHVKQLNYTAAAVISSAKPGYTTLKCGLCNCPLSAKTLSPKSHCPISKW